MMVLGNFQCWGVLLILIIVGQGPTVLTVGAGGGCLDNFSLSFGISSLLSLGDRLRYCLRGLLNGVFLVEIRNFSPSKYLDSAQQRQNFFFLHDLAIIILLLYIIIKTY